MSRGLLSDLLWRCWCKWAMAVPWGCRKARAGQMPSRGFALAGGCEWLQGEPWAAGLGGDRGLMEGSAPLSFSPWTQISLPPEDLGQSGLGRDHSAIERSHPAPPPPRGEAPGLHRPPHPKSEDRGMGMRGPPGRAVPGAVLGVADPGSGAGSCRDESSVRPQGDV